MCTKYADCHVTVIIEVWFVYPSRGNFTSVILESFCPALLFDLDVSEQLLLLLLEVKDMGFFLPFGHDELFSFSSQMEALVSIICNLAVFMRSFMFFYWRFDTVDSFVSLLCC